MLELSLFFRCVGLLGVEVIPGVLLYDRGDATSHPKILGLSVFKLI